MLGHSGTVAVSEGGFVAAELQGTCVEDVTNSVYRVAVGIWRFGGYVESLTARNLEVRAGR